MTTDTNSSQASNEHEADASRLTQIIDDLIKAEDHFERLRLTLEAHGALTRAASRLEVKR
jgi:hypothetical protein